jgi:uncharacterized protein YecT (DUF1311 family)
MHRAISFPGSIVAAVALTGAPCWVESVELQAQHDGQTLTQRDLDQDAGASFKAADVELNQVYQDIRRRYRDEPLFLEKLKLAQRAWLKFRDAELEALYPLASDGDPLTVYGSIYPMCYASAKEQLTQERTAQLRRWLDRVQEGDTCAGSKR